MKEKKVKVPKPFYKKWWFVLVVLIVLISAIGATGGDDSNDGVASDTTEANSVEKADVTTEVATVEETTEDVDTYNAGMYKVGSDIMPGLYRVELDGILNMGYVERSKDASMTLDSILANILLTGNGYAEIKETDSFVKITGAILTPFDLTDAVSSFASEYSDGMYLVGIDIEPGEYKVEVTDTATKMGYVERLSDASYNFDSIISNSLIQNQAYVTIEATDFAVRLQGVKLSK